ncbi:type II toxin-antitoxin system RelE/ParE family toxin [Nitrospira defluvii]|uniref:Endoribonuclease HigB n=1 Tax=Nitrospira defluvii TaxID=330214 RepID=A0ABM8S9H5_9BACT|nr:type II toxin-antitoxin system RelE/ParE family toxin [Nitrospira defluvii]CAE6796070.1 Endoribonuclease HigB [Nitrospira defluvii]
MIIRSVRHRGLKRFVERDQSSGLRPDLVDRIRNILTALIVAENIRMFRDGAPSGWRVHQLSGDRKGTWSISTSGNWRITFQEEHGYVDLLDLEDYH